MQRTKVFLHPSCYEGFGCVCLEALHGGAHVISFCKPMNTNISHWHIVKTKEEMTRETLRILQDPMTSYLSVHRYPIRECVNQVMNLFGEKYYSIEKGG